MSCCKFLVLEVGELRHQPCSKIVVSSKVFESKCFNAALHFLNHAQQKMHFMIILYLKVMLDDMIGSANRIVVMLWKLCRQLQKARYVQNKHNILIITVSIRIRIINKIPQIKWDHLLFFSTVDLFDKKFNKTWFDKLWLLRLCLTSF